MSTKQCNNCLQEKELSYFSINKISKNGNKVYKSICKACHCENEKKRRQNNIEKFREKAQEYYNDNKEEILIKNKEYRSLNKTEIIEQKKTYYHNNRDIILLYHKNNKEKRNERLSNKIKTDKVYAIKCSLKTRLYELIKNKNFSFSKIINTNCENLVNWFEYQFKDNINWDNYGKEWHADHVIPISFFNLEDLNDRQICFHWTNLRPLNSMENMKKSCKIIPEEILLHIKILSSYLLESNNGYQANYENIWWRRIELRYGNNPEDNLCSILTEYKEMDNSQPSS
jgi:hypothetical protein